MTAELQALTAVDPYWIRGSVDQLAIEEGCWFDEEAGQAACDFVEQHCRQSQGRWRGEPIVLIDWERDFLMRLFGWKRPDGTRRYRRVFILIAKKNGKSTLISALCLILLEIDDEGSPQIHLNACDLKQTKVIFDECVQMVLASPELAAILTIIESKGRIVDKERNGAIIANTSTADTKDGPNPSAVVFDELHRLQGREQTDVYEYASDARDQPLRIDLTTAGEEEEGVWHEQLEYAEQVNAGLVPDTTYLGIVYRALPGDDLDSPETWRKANPALGSILKEEDFRRALAKAKLQPQLWANFCRLKLNIVTRTSVKAFDMEKWAACGKPVNTASLGRRPFWAGLDLASTSDLAALIILYGSYAEGFDLIARFWLPKDNIVELQRKAKVTYDLWVRQGYITLTEGSAIDYDFIRKEVKELAATGDMRKLFSDPWNADQLITKFIDDDGLPCEAIRQGFASLSAPTKELLRLIATGKIRHGGNPVLSWHISNAVSVEDANQNIMLHKQKSRKKIDGAAALVNAVAASMADGATKESVYETRGVAWI